MTDYTFTATGDSSWVVPAGVTSLTIGECYSGGQSGADDNGHNDPDDGTFLVDHIGIGGYGGNYANDINIAVTPGETLSIRVGTGGTYPFNSNNYLATTNGGDSWIKRSSTVLVLAPGGSSAGGASGFGATKHSGGAPTGGDSVPGLGGSAATSSSNGSAGAATGATGDGGGTVQNGRPGKVVITATPGGGGGGGATGPAISAVVML